MYADPAAHENDAKSSTPGADEIDVARRPGEDRDADEAGADPGCGEARQAHAEAEAVERLP